MLYHVYTADRVAKFNERMTAQHTSDEFIFTPQASASTKGESDRLLEGLETFVARAVASGAKEVFLPDCVLDRFDIAMGDRVAACVKPLLDKGVEIFPTSMDTDNPIVITLRSAAKNAGYKTKITTSVRNLKKGAAV